MSTDVELRQPGAWNFHDEDEDESECQCFCAFVACGMIVYEIYDIVSDSITTHKYGQGELSNHNNKLLYRSSLAFTIFGSLLAVPKIALYVMDIAIGFCGATEEIWKKKTDRVVNFIVLLLEAFPQAIIAVCFLDVDGCPPQKLDEWPLFSFATCAIVPCFSSMCSLGGFLCKYCEECGECWMMNLLCCFGIVLALATFGIAVTAIVLDAMSTATTVSLHILAATDCQL